MSNTVKPTGPTGQPLRNFVAFDLDGVLADFAHGFSQLAARYHRLERHTTTLTQPSFRWLSEQGVSRAEQDALWDKVLESGDFWFNLPDLTSKHDKELMLELAEDANQRIIYVTNRHNKGTMLAQTELWLHKYGFPEGPVLPCAEKAKLLMALPSLRAVLDDSPYNLEAFEYWNMPAFAMHRAYNIEHATSLPRVNSVEEFCEHLLDDIFEGMEA